MTEEERRGGVSLVSWSGREGVEDEGMRAARGST